MLTPALLLLLAAAPATEAVRKDLFYLAGDECEGRGLETEGLRRAGQYIADGFQAAGLQPGPDGFFQPFPVYTGGVQRGATNTVVARPKGGDPVTLAVDADFAPLAGTGDTTGRLVFAGYGISAPGLKYDDYAGLDVAGKWVVILRRTPRAENKEKPFDPADDSAYGSLVYKLGAAAARKAAGVVFVNDRTYGKADDRPIDPALLTTAKFPVVQLKRAALAKLLPAGKTLDAIEAGIDADTKPNSFPLDWTLTAELSMTRKSLPTRNVVGVLPGAGPLADETVVVGAHYDHLGNGEPGSMLGARGKGQRHYGADDNASGTTGLLELARRLGAQKGRTGRRVVFVAFSGEERGLFGSKHYVEHPLFPLETTVFMLNMDMIGRASPAPDAPAGKPKKDRMVVYGTGTGTGLEAAAEKFNQGPDFQLIKVPTGRGPSDHQSFFEQKVPVLFLFTGTHRDYHTPADTPDKVNLPALVRAVDYAQGLTEHFAGLPERPKFDAAKGDGFDPTEAKPKTPLRKGGPRLGFMPGNYGEEGGGVLVEDLVAGGAAEAAGLKKGDRIVALAGKPVADINVYTTELARLKPGVEIEVTVIRGGDKKTIKVTPK